MSPSHHRIFRGIAGARLRSSGFLALVAALGLVLPGCVVYDRLSDVRLYWTFAGSDNCARSEVDRVQVVLDSLDGSTYVDSALVRCEDGFVEFHELDRGEYRVTALAFPRRGGRATWDSDIDVRLHGGFNELTIDLVPSGSW